jgi:hypothetical protein
MGGVAFGVFGMGWDGFGEGKEGYVLREDEEGQEDLLGLGLAVTCGGIVIYIRCRIRYCCGERG